MTQNIGVGVDLGSSALRVSTYNYDNDSLINTCSRKVSYYTNSHERQQCWQYAQSSVEINEALEFCLAQLNITKDRVQALGVAATCSMVVMCSDNRTPFELFSNEKKPHYPLNVVFWMDGKSAKESQALNTHALSKYELDCLGGSGFISEMGIPKLSHLLNSSCKNPVVYDLHKYLAHQICQKFAWGSRSLENTENINGIGHDGEISGWSDTIYHQVQDTCQNSFTIGPPKCNIPSSTIKVSSFIDCYAGWFATVPEPNTSMTMVAGTSTCYLFASTEPQFHIDGIWGPFTNVLSQNDNVNVYQGGSSLTGRLLEHILINHPYSIRENLTDVDTIVTMIETYISSYETGQSGELFQHLTRKMFLYGDLEGNRTPFGDSQLKGVFIGETLDVSLHNLSMKYVVTLEFLAFQTKMILAKFPKIDKLYIIGSQSKNTRLLSMIKTVLMDIDIFIAKDIECEEYIGPKGAYLASKYGKDVLNLQNSEFFEQPSLNNRYLTAGARKILFELMTKKYDITVDIIKSQQRYNSIMD